ncbi:MAG: lipid-transfer protein [Candidatus Dadabacteria bacterium]|nr:MAG: lipid-transfer protein [Candidatus Dadabacteria bacterium]
MRDVAVISFAQAKSVRRDTDRNEVEIVMPVVSEAIERAGLDRKEIGFTCSGSSDYLAGIAFSFVTALDAIGAWPPIEESHVEMDGAWALAEAWVRLQHGDVDSALVYGFGKSSLGDIGEILSRQLDPYTVAPLWPDPIAIAALQARAMIEAGKCDERRMAEVAVRSRRDAMGNPYAQVKGEFDVEALLEEPYVASPLRKHDCPPISDGAAAVVLAAGDLARAKCERPAWIRGLDHRIDIHHVGARDLTRAPSARLAAERAGVGRDKIDVAELYAPFTHQELLLREELGLSDSVRINPSGGALAANPLMAAGLIRIGEAAQRIIDGQADRVVAHATSGPCLQQNLVCVMEGE